MSNNNPEAVFRGYRELCEIAARVSNLATNYDLMGDHKYSIHLNPKDYYYVSRWPKAGALAGFSYDKPNPFDTSIRWKTHPIVRVPGEYSLPKKKGRK